MEKLVVPGKLDSLADVATYVQQAADRAGLDYRSGYRLRLAVDEIVTNVITHGYEDKDKPGTIQVQAEIDEEYLTIHMDDDGSTYNPAEALPPDNIRGPITERRLGGLGIYLALWGVDHFYYHRLQKCNRSTFKVHRSQR